jgi:hypothetical protein
VPWFKQRSSGVTHKKPAQRAGFFNHRSRPKHDSQLAPNQPFSVRIQRCRCIYCVLHGLTLERPEWMISAEPIQVRYATDDETLSSNARLTLLITLSQSPKDGCRKMRAVGYHGLSSRSANQRQQVL